MARLNSLASWFFTCLGITLLIVAALAAPENVFADTGSDCAAGCQTACGSDPNCYNWCIANCCACGTDQTCYNNCVGVACNQGNGYCKFDTKTNCHGVDRTCFMDISKCWCLWDENTDPKCQCRKR